MLVENGHNDAVCRVPALLRYVPLRTNVMLVYTRRTCLHLGTMLPTVHKRHDWLVHATH